MKQKGKRTLTPKLRFFEFRDASGWEEKTVNAISDVNPNHDGLPDSFVYIDLESVEQGKLVAQKIINREDAPSRAQRLLRKRDVIYQTVRPYQRNNLFFDIEDDRDYVASTGYAQLRAHASPAFLFQLLHTNDFVNRVLAKCTGSNYPAINSSDLAAIEVALPSPPEQQKIADCLSSLDGLIASEGRKLEALKAHKKGLMQQLFPQPGQTQPRLRFPEFRDAGEWVARKLKKVAPLQRGFDLPSREIREGTVPIVYSNGIRGTHAIGMATGPGLVTGRSGTIGKLHYIESGDYWPHNTTLWVTDFYGNLPKFIYYLYDAIGLERFSSGSGVPTLNRNDVHGFKSAVPKQIDEQQCIANCLSALDTQISAQAKKIESLKQHKRGLMQQLFPSPEED